LKTFRNFTLIIILVLNFTEKIFSQYKDINQINNSTTILFKGKLLDEKGNFITLAYIVNQKKRYITYSDTLGEFKLSVSLNDTLKVSNIGFETKFIAINRKLFTKDTINQVIIMPSKTYLLGEVNINYLRWLKFKSEFMATKPKEDKNTKRLITWVHNLIPKGELALLDKSVRGSGLQINYRNKSVRQKMEVALLEKKDKIIQDKYNDKLIKDLTGLSANESYKFLIFCGFNEDFLINSTEYEIIEALQLRWEEYKKK